MSAAGTAAAADDEPPLPSLEVPMEELPDVVVPRLELAVRATPPPPSPVPASELVVPEEPVVDELPMEPVPPEHAVEEPVAEVVDELVAGQERREAGPAALPPKAPEPVSTAVTRPVRPPAELDRRHPVRGLLGLLVVVVFGAIAIAVTVGAGIAAVMLAVRGGVGS